MSPTDLMLILGQAEALLADGFEDALVGYVERAGGLLVALYDRGRCIDILAAEGQCDLSEAEEYFEFNVVSAYMGEGTPCFGTFTKSGSV